MLNIAKQGKDVIADNPYREYYNEEHLYVVKEDEKEVAYLSFLINDDNTMYLYMIEVIEKGKGIGRNIIKHLINYYSLESIKGFVLDEKRAYIFWRSLGAEIYYVDVEGYEIEELLEDGLDSSFILYKNRAKF